MSTTVKNTISISDKALNELINAGAGTETFLRIWVSAGGCQGNTYQAGLDTERDPDDVVLYESKDLLVLGDSKSAESLPGLVIDFSDDLSTHGFRFSNPNAKATCSCGSSFCG